MLLLEAFRFGGWPMYPTLVFGITLVAAAVHHAKHPGARQLVLVQNLRLATLLSGLLGSIFGLIHSLQGLGGLLPDQPHGKYALIGLGESINNIGLALVMILMATLVTTIGATREAAASPDGE